MSTIKPGKQIFLKQAPFIAALVLFSVLIFSALKFTQFKKGQWEKDIRNRLLETLVAKKSNLEKALFSRIYYTKSIAAYVSLHPEVSRTEYNNLAEELIQKDSVICTMSLSKDCIISAVYPIEGHEAALGLDLLSHPERRKIVEKTIETHHAFVAGPVELIEGGEAFISYNPIFDKTMENMGSFWGVTDIVIYKHPLLAEAQIFESEGDFIFALRGIDGIGDSGTVFWGDPSVFTMKPEKINIELPYGNWVLAASPKNGWAAYTDQDQLLLIFLIISSFIISILLAFFSRAMVRIRKNQQELKAIFKSMSGIVIEFNDEGRYLQIAPSNQDLLVKPKEEMLGKTVFEIFDKETARLFYENINKCLRTKELTILEYPTIVSGREKWFVARISYRSENKVIFQAHDISAQKKQEQDLAESAKYMKELNATKDKLFSIIAHDLKSPFNQISGFSQILMLEYDDLTNEDRKKFIKIINQGSNQTVWLVDNLLKWAQSQRSMLKINSEKLVLLNVVRNSMKTFITKAAQKDIELTTTITEEILVTADEDMLSSVLRNLISNAIKFTFRGNRIKISIENHPTIENKYILSIEDKGVGMDTETLGNLFHIDSNTSGLGTEKESGTGLGLILCKDLINISGQEIWAESRVHDPEQGIQGGSTFFFTIDKA